jgi:hypothetical protein
VIDICGGTVRESAPTAPSQFAKSAPAMKDVTTSAPSGAGGFALPVDQVPMVPSEPLRNSHA